MTIAPRLCTALARAWRALRRLAGDDAYERYLAHWHARHALPGSTPLGRRAFYRAEVERKWSGVSRCC
ncbi:MAG: YbdD/YjiX family protein [Gammaproteobacteria bacterium]|nr:YbdD/YjiX family protein [Gammaproteobacteria bacterium]